MSGFWRSPKNFRHKFDGPVRFVTKWRQMNTLSYIGARQTTPSYVSTAKPVQDFNENQEFLIQGAPAEVGEPLRSSLGPHLDRARGKLVRLSHKGEPRHFINRFNAPKAANGWRVRRSDKSLRYHKQLQTGRVRVSVSQCKPLKYVGFSSASPLTNRVPKPYIVKTPSALTYSSASVLGGAEWSNG